MRVSSAAIFTLATLASSNFTQKATATPATQTAKTPSVVIPVVEDSPTPPEVGTIPETINDHQFSPNPLIGQKDRQQNSPVIFQPVTTPNPPIEQKIVLQPTKKNPAPTPATDDNLVITATSVQILGANPELQQIIRQVIKTQPGGETSQIQLQKDVLAILDTGLFVSAFANSTTTPTGLNVVYQVQPVIVRGLELSGANVLTYQVALEQLQPQVGKVISPAELGQAVTQINKWYAAKGYNLARVLSIKPSPNGILTLNVAEGLVGEIKFRFVNDQGKTVDSQGKPVKGRTKPEFLRQQLKSKPGQVFQENLVKQDIQELSRLGLFETVNVALEGDAKKVDLVYEVKEVGARAVNLGGNYNADQGLVVTLSYKDQNVGGVNDTLGVNVGVGRRDIQFDTRFTSPYRESNPDRLGYSVNAFRRRELSETFDDTIKLANGDKVREGHFGGGISLQRPIDGWNTSLGFNYTRTSIRDREGKITPTDAKGNPLTLSGTGIDELTTVSFTATQDHRDNPTQPTHGSVVSLSTEQSVPLGLGNISMNRLRANYSQYVPVNLFKSKQPQVFALNLQAGTVIGDLPPYETFNLGGANSVRGYDPGDVGSGRSYVLASAEYRFPIIPIVGGVVFADYASDLGSGDTVLGNPAGMRGKPGQGFGYGAGVRVDSPLGLIRADYGINDQGESRVHLGLGQRF
jgi:outer membrane protein insertion porin family